MNINTPPRKPQLRKLALPIKLLALDVDGVLTDGTLWYGEEKIELKGFNIQDGLGIKLLQKCGIRVALITGRKSGMVERRASELGIEHIVQGREDKRAALQEIQQQLDLEQHEIAYMGDDLPDLSAIHYAGLGIAVANACDTVKEYANHVTVHRGGQGAVREICELLLTMQGQWDSAIEDFLP